MSKHRKYWSKKIEEHGVRVRVYERPGSSSLWFSTMQDGRKRRRSLDTSNRTLAEDRARAIGRELARARLTGVEPNTLTLTQAFVLYRTHHFPNITPSWQKTAETRMGVFLEAWDPDMLVADVSQTYADSYSRRRMAGTLAPEYNRKEKAVGAGTVDAEFRWLSGVFNFVRRHKVGGKRLLEENPLHDVKWPRERNVMQPVADSDRFTRTLQHVDTVDPAGRLGCMLSLARYTGRRESAICKLRASDFLRDPASIRAALASMGFDENRADHMPFGAIAWRDENDKMGFSAIAPLGGAARAALDAYMSKNPRVGEAWLFPAPKDDSKPVRRQSAARWLREAEKLAGLPKLNGGTWHPYRRLWASERKHLPDVDVAAAGGWQDVRSMLASYQKADAATQLAVVEAMG